MNDCRYMYSKNNMACPHEEYQTKKENKGSIEEQRTHSNLDAKHPEESIRSNILWRVTTSRTRSCMDKEDMIGNYVTIEEIPCHQSLSIPVIKDSDTSHLHHMMM